MSIEPIKLLADPRIVCEGICRKLESNRKETNRSTVSSAVCGCPKTPRPQSLRPQQRNGPLPAKGFPEFPGLSKAWAPLLLLSSLAQTRPCDLSVLVWPILSHGLQKVEHLLLLGSWGKKKKRTPKSMEKSGEFSSVPHAALAPAFRRSGRARSWTARRAPGGGSNGRDLANRPVPWSF